MKKIVIISSLVLVLGLGVAAHKANAAPDFMNIIQKVVSKFELAIAKINDRLQAQVIHVTLADQNCTTDRTTGIELGWCPDGTKSSFSIIDPNFKVGQSVLTGQATNIETDSIVKVNNCALRAVTNTNVTPFIRLVCEAAPLDTATLNYVITNH